MSITAGPDADSVEVTFREDARIGRLWGIPFIGSLVRGIVAIPLFVVAFVLGIAAFMAVLVAQACRAKGPHPARAQSCT